MANVDKPLLYILATEDNSITVLGNSLLQRSFQEHPAPAWKVEVAEAGHWSFSDLCGLIDLYSPGCGEDRRMTDGNQTVTYVDNTLARSIASEYVLAFFRHTLLNDSEGRAYLDKATPSGAVTLESHD